jgi:hypothetical protein
LKARTRPNPKAETGDPKSKSTDFRGCSLGLRASEFGLLSGFGLRVSGCLRQVGLILNQAPNPPRHTPLLVWSYQSQVKNEKHDLFERSGLFAAYLKQRDVCADDGAPLPRLNERRDYEHELKR